MATNSKNALIAAGLLATLLSSSRADADTIRIDRLAALDLSEHDDGFDRIRIEYFVDGGKMQQVGRKMRLGNIWNVGLDITFSREVTIQLYEKEKWIKKDKKLGAFTLRAGSIADGKSEVFNLTGHGARYWMLIGRGKYVAPQPPAANQAPPPKPVWLDGGTYSTPDAASSAGERLVMTGSATQFRVIEGIDLGLNSRVWRLQYVAKPKD